MVQSEIFKTFFSEKVEFFLLIFKFSLNFYNDFLPLRFRQHRKAWVLHYRDGYLGFLLLLSAFQLLCLANW